MPTDWVTVSGVLSNLTGAVEVGYSYAPYAKYSGDSAADILKQVDKVLQSANTVLENHRDLIPANEFQDLKRTYCRYHWQMTNDSQEDRATTDKLIRQSRILSQLYAKKEPHVQRARNLLHQVETFQTRVLSASRSAQPPDTLMLFDDEIAEQTAAQQSAQAEATSSNHSYTSWFSAFGRAQRPESTTTTESESTKVESDTPSYVTEGHGFIISVTHFPKSESESTSDDQKIVGTGSNIFRRMISFENAEKRVEIIDPKLYALDSNETYIPEDSLRAMSALGQSLLSQSDSGSPAGSRVVSDLTAGPSLETTIQNFKKMSIDVVGGKK